MDSTRHLVPTTRPAGATTGGRQRRPMGRRPAALLALAVLSGAFLLPATASAATTTAAATDGATATAACTGGAWPAAAQGAPIVHAGSAAGDYLWHDATGWHLRVTHVGTAAVVFSGTIHANRPLHVVGYRLESGDHFTVSADHLTVTYRFVNHGRLDGLNFTTECATRLTVGGRMNGSLLPVRRIWIGHGGRHPLQDPFVILRTA